MKQTPKVKTLSPQGLKRIANAVLHALKRLKRQKQLREIQEVARR